MNKYVVTVIMTDKAGNLKEKSVLCNTDIEMFELVQNAVTEKLLYVVYKAQLEQVLNGNNS